jgi:type IV secretion system protein VirD4
VLEASAAADGWLKRGQRNAIALFKMGLFASVGVGALFAIPAAFGFSPALALVPVVGGAALVGYLRAASHFKVRYSNAGGNARWGTLKDEAVRNLLAPSSRKPHSLSKSERNIYCGEIGSRRTRVYYPGVKHGLIQGPPRAGKDSGIFTENLLHLDDWSIMVIDPKGEQAAATMRHRAKCGDVLIFNPFGMHGLRSDGFNPLLMSSFLENRFEVGVSIVRSLIPLDEKRQEIIWPAGAQELVLALILYVCIEAEKKGDELPSLARVNEHLRLPYTSAKHNTPTLYQLMQDLTQHENDELRQVAVTFGQVTHDDRIIQSFLASARVPLTHLINKTLLADLTRHPIVGDEPFDFRMMKNRVMTVYVIMPDDKLSEYDFWLRMVVGCGLKAMNAGLPGSVRQLAMINEAGNLGRLDSLERAMMMGAEKLTVILAVQYLSQLDDLYGRNKRNSFLTGAGFFSSFGSGGDEITAEYISRRAGKWTVPEKRFAIKEDGAARSVGEDPVSHPLIHPSDVMSLSGRKLISWIEPAQQYPLKLTAPRSLRGDPNPYYARS